MNKIFLFIIIAALAGCGQNNPPAVQVVTPAPIGVTDDDGCIVEDDGDIECNGIEIFDPQDYAKKKKLKAKKVTAPTAKAAKTVAMKSTTKSKSKK